jgi:hypothetical protein
MSDMMMNTVRRLGNVARCAQLRRREKKEEAERERGRSRRRGKWMILADTALLTETFLSFCARTRRKRGQA